MGPTAQGEAPLGRLGILTSAVTYAAAFLVTTLLHELAHFVVALALGRAPVLYHNSVVSQDAALAATVATSLAGPVFSLVQGLGLALLEPRTRELRPTSRLFIVWLAFHGLMNATGYLFTTWFVPDADLGSAMRLLGLPWPALAALTAAGFFAIRYGARAIYPGFVALLPEEARAEVKARNRGLIRLALIPWPIGVLLCLPSSFPVPHWISLTYVVIAGIGAVWFTDFSKAEPDAPARPGAPLPERFAIGPLVAWAALTALCLVVLRHGVG